MSQQFIKLTTKTDTSVYINPITIVGMEERADGGTKIRSMGGEYASWAVKQTPQEILIMIQRADYLTLINKSEEVSWDTQTK